MLVVEDDVRVAAALASALRRRRYTVTCSASASEALSSPEADLVLLDMGLPDRDGLALCRELRHRQPEVSIIAVTARGDECDRVAGLRAGADDYVVKPFSMVELQARIDAVLRRAVRGARRTDAVDVGELKLDAVSRSATLSGREIALTPKEFDILFVLACRRGSAVPRQELLLAVWHTAAGAERALEVHMATLRAKLGDPDRIETVRGVGYSLRSQ